MARAPAPVPWSEQSPALSGAVRGPAAAAAPARSLVRAFGGRAGVFIALACVAAAIVLVIAEASYLRAAASLASVQERGDARTAIQTVMRRILDGETAQRGYLLTGRREYLAPYADGAGDIARAIAVLRRHAAADPQLAAMVDDLATRLLEKQSEMAETIARFDAGQHEVWRNLVLTDIGREKMEGVRKAAEALLAVEDRRVADERGAVLRTLSAGRYGVCAMTALSLLALVFFLRKTAALQRAQRVHAEALQAERDALEIEVGHRTAELTELARHLQSAREDERGHLARELHDELGALLTAAKLDVARLKRSLGTPAPDIAQRLAHLVSLIDQGISLKRRIIEDLRPSSLSNLGLAAALEIQAREFEQRSGLKVRTDLAEVRLPDAAQIVVYRVVQESLTNIAKHARARAVALSIGSDAGLVRLRIADDGQGFETSASTPSAHGLVGMRYRVESVGGELRLMSRPGSGTVIEALIPEPADAAHEAAVTSAAAG